MKVKTMRHGPAVELRLSEAALLLGTTPMTLRNMTHDGRLPFTRDAHGWRVVRLSDVQGMILARSTTAVRQGRPRVAEALLKRAQAGVAA